MSRDIDIDLIHKGWLDAVATEAPHIDGLSALLDDHLEQLERRSDIDEGHLLLVIDEAIEFATRSSDAITVSRLGKRLRRSVYEYLLALDAVAAQSEGPTEDEIDGVGPRRPNPVDRPPEYTGPADSASSPITDRGAFLIGAEEVAHLTPAEAPVSHGDEPPTPSEAPAEPTHAGPTGATSEAIADAQEAPPDSDATGADQPDKPEISADLGGAIPHKRRFGLFRRGGGPHEDSAASDAGSEIAVPVDAIVEDEQSHSVVEPEPEPAPEPRPAPTLVVRHDPVPEPASQPDRVSEPLAIAPRDGFHLGDPAEAAASHQTGSDGTTFHSSISFDLNDSQILSDGVDLEAAQHKIDEKLRKKRFNDAAALVQQLAQEVGGRKVAELALTAGDRCRSLGKRQAATNCYLAASRADPVYEAPWARLADVCIDDKELDLAVSYLERVARLTRLRGDIRGSLRIYRKIVTIAPHREDIMEMLMRAESTGRMEP